MAIYKWHREKIGNIHHTIKVCIDEHTKGWCPWCECEHDIDINSDDNSYQLDCPLDPDDWCNDDNIEDHWKYCDLEEERDNIRHTLDEKEGEVNILEDENERLKNIIRGLEDDKFALEHEIGLLRK